MNMPLAVLNCNSPVQTNVSNSCLPGYFLMVVRDHANSYQTVLDTQFLSSQNHPYLLPESTTMCQYALYRSPRCGCRWLAITEQCFVGAGFSTCEALQRETSSDGRMHPSVPAFRASRGSCPRHALDGYYDYNQTRMVVRIRNGFHLGTGGNRTDPGFDVSWGCQCM